MMKYHEQLRHPLWQKKRLEVLEHYGFKCQECGATEHELHVHHPFYKRGAMIWDYGVDELRCLCGKCHKDAHAVDEATKLALAACDSTHKIEVLGFIDQLTGRDPRQEYADLLCYFFGYVGGLNIDHTELARDAYPNHEGVRGPCASLS